jgi:hypothetical protein
MNHEANSHDPRAIKQSNVQSHKSVCLPTIDFSLLKNIIKRGSILEFLIKGNF